MRALDALRQRVPPSIGGTRGYYPVSVADDSDAFEAPGYTPTYSNVRVIRRKELDAAVHRGRPGPCVKGCCAFSLGGVMFLSLLGRMLARSPYLLLEYSSDDKHSLANSVFGAAALYLVVACLTAYAWYRSVCQQRSPTLGEEGRYG